MLACPMNGMPLRLRALLHSSAERSSTKAYLLFTRHDTTGLPGVVMRFTYHVPAIVKNSSSGGETGGRGGARDGGG